MTPGDQGPAQLIGRDLQVCENIAARRGQGPPPVIPGSQLPADDEVLRPFELSHAVASGIACSLDHITALRLLMVDAEMLPAVAPFTLLRAAVENAAVAVWLLAPTDPVERRTRNLLVNLDDGHDAAGALTLIRHPSAGTLEAARRTDVLALVAAAGVDPGRLAGRRPGWGAKVHAAGEQVRGLTGDDLQFVWSYCSGYAHGRRWAQLAMGELEAVNHPRSGADLYSVTASLATLAHALHAATMVLQAAVRMENTARLRWR